MLKTEQLLSTAREALTHGGWSENRRVAVESTATLSRCHDSEIPERILDLLSNLWGIRASIMGRWVDFSAEPTASLISQEDLQLLERLAGERYYMLGSASCAYLFLSGSGAAVYLDSDWLFFHAFRDVAALCNCILAGDNSAIQFSRQLSLQERPTDLH